MSGQQSCASESSASTTERTPLISRASSSATASTLLDSQDGGALEYKREDIGTALMFFQEWRTIGAFALPTFISQVLDYSLVFVSVFTLGHISITALAAISLATMTANVTGMSIIHGFCSALDTLLPPAWTSDQPGMMRVWVQRVAVGVVAQILLIWTLWYNIEGILLKLRQDPEVAALAATYLKVECIGLPAFAVSTIMRRWFFAQGLFSIPTRLLVIVSPLNLALNYTLVLGAPFGLFRSLRLGFIGAPISTAASQWLLMVMNVVYAYKWVDRRGWYGVDDTEMATGGEAEGAEVVVLNNNNTKTKKIGYGKGKGLYGWCIDEAFDPEGLSLVTKLGLSGIGQLVTDWWAWEILVLAASLFGPVVLAAQSVLGTTGAMLFQPVVSVAIATPVRIGNLMGEKNARRAGIAANAAMALALFVSCSTSLILLVMGDSWGAMFTDDPVVVSLIADVLPVAALFPILDGSAVVAGGIMRAKGQQFVGATVNTISYWVIGLPLAAWLGFGVGWRLKGLWIGYTFCLFLTAAVGSGLAFVTDWREETRKVVKRLEKERMEVARLELEY